MKKYMAFAMAGAAMVAFSGAANATQYLQVTGVSNVYTGAPTADLHKTSNPTEEVNNALVTPQKLTGYFTDNKTVPVELFAYCVDIFDAAGTGKFEVVSASSYLSAAKFNVLAQLISAQGAKTSVAHDAAVQLAIWEIVNESSTNAFNLDKVGYGYSAPKQFWVDDVEGKSSSGIISLAEGFIADAVKNAGKTTPGLTLYVAKSDVKQDMLFWTYETPVPSIPEPASWAMMIVGMGAVGYSMRRRKVDVSFA
jgi:hypothetical protein